jgi:MOSC domain-containing protein YiiM
MASARIFSVNRGREADLVVGGKPARTGINKQPVTGAVAVRTLGLAEDEYADKASHGGRDQAVYAYAREDLDWWTEQLGRELRSRRAEPSGADGHSPRVNAGLLRWSPDHAQAAGG